MKESDKDGVLHMDFLLNSNENQRYLSTCVMYLNFMPVGRRNWFVTFFPYIHRTIDIFVESFN